MRGRSISIYWESVVLGLAILGGIVALSFYSNQRLDRLRRERDRNGVFVIGDVVSETNNLKGALIVDYRYTLAGREYSNSMLTDRWFDDKPASTQRRYFTQIAVSNPYNAELLLDHPVPDSIRRSPDRGWVRMPGQ